MKRPGRQCPQTSSTRPLPVHSVADYLSTHVQQTQWRMETSPVKAKRMHFVAALGVRPSFIRTVRSSAMGMYPSCLECLPSVASRSALRPCWHQASRTPGPVNRLRHRVPHSSFSGYIRWLRIQGSSERRVVIFAQKLASHDVAKPRGKHLEVAEKAEMTSH